MRHLRRKSDAELLTAILDQQDPRMRTTKAPEARPASQNRRTMPWRFYIPFIVVLLASAAAGAYFLRDDWAAMVRAYQRWTGDTPQVSTPSNALPGRPMIIDGDTIEIRGQRIRLWGIDAPETAQLCARDGKPWSCGVDATYALAEWIGERTAICEHRGVDQYGRIIGRCFVGGTDVSAWLVENGWALAFRRYSLDYVGHEDRARRMRAGIWSSEFQPPWEWRAARRMSP